jgi:hypothetical protein
LEGGNITLVKKVRKKNRLKNEIEIILFQLNIDIIWVYVL